MRTSERHHLKDNELALALQQANEWATTNQRNLAMTLGGIIVIAGSIGGYILWRNSVDDKAQSLLAQAMVVESARVVPPAPTPAPVPATNSTPSAAAVALQPPGTYPTERAKLEAALPKFMTAAESYPSTEAGRIARYQAGAVLVGLGRYDEALAQYDRVIAEGSGLLPQMGRLGKAEAQLRGSKYDAAIASFKELSERTDMTVPKEAMMMELARAYKLAGKNDDAKKTLNQIVEQHGDSPFAAEARQELDKLQS
jgi:predicted negative regulator of RcsB-dependent stress response